MNFENQEEALNSIIMDIRANKKLPTNYQKMENYFHKSFLFYCVEKNKINIIRELLEAGDDFTRNIMDDCGRENKLNAFTASIQIGQTECLKIFLEFGANLFIREYGYGRGDAWRMARHAETILFLHNNKKIDFNQKDKDGSTLLGRMITEAHQIKDVEEICKIIDLNTLDINLGSSLNSGGVNRSPLMIAINRGILPIVKKLVENGAHLNYKKEDGENIELLAFALEKSKEQGQTPIWQEVFEYLKAWDEKNRLNQHIGKMDGLGSVNKL